MPERDPLATHSQVSDADDLRALVYAKDWSETRIGATEHWSPTLKILVDFLLADRFPPLLWWGPDYVSIYNDAYRPILGTKHPRALGQPFREVWPEIAHTLTPLRLCRERGGRPWRSRARNGGPEQALRNHQPGRSCPWADRSLTARGNL